MDDASVHDTETPSETVPDLQPSQPPVDDPAPVAEQSAPTPAWMPPGDDSPFFADAEPVAPVPAQAPAPSVPAPAREAASAFAEQPQPELPVVAESFEALVAAAAAPLTPAPDTDLAAAEPELPEDLRALSESLEQPTGAIAPVAAADVAAVSQAPAPQLASAEDLPGEPVAAEDEPGVTHMLDQIAPGTVATEASEAQETAADEAAADADAEAETADAVDQELADLAPKRTVSWWPFVAYIVVWLGGAGYLVWQMQQVPAGQAPYETYLYSQSMLAGLVMLAVGPALALVVWLASWIARDNVRIGAMFVSALVKGASATLLGAVIWMGALMLIDYLRLGKPF